MRYILLKPVHSTPVAVRMAQLWNYLIW